MGRTVMMRVRALTNSTGHWQKQCLFWGLASLLAVSYLWIHHRASFFCPAPWPDEGQFLWPAITFQRSNTLFAPQINPDMTIMWMPPGYMVWHGLIFKLTGASFRLARWLSGVYILGGMYFFLRTTLRQGLKWTALYLAGVFLLSKWFIFSGNLARMEGLVFLMVSAAFFLLATKQHYKALILLSLSPLVHPNGLYFCMGGGLYFLYRIYGHPEERKCSTVDKWLLLLPLGLWSAYLVYIGAHYREFQAHMPLQFTWKKQMLSLQGGVFWESLKPSQFLGVAILLACVLYARHKKLPYYLLAAFAVSAKMLVLTAAGEQYGVYDALFSLIVSVLVILTVAQVVRGTRLPLAAQEAVLGVALVALTGAGYAIDHLGLPTDRWGRAGVFGSLPPGNNTYLSSEEEQHIRNFIASLHSPKPIRIQFYPESEALLFQDVDGERIRLCHPTFCERVDPVTKWTVYKAPADVHIVHLSAYTPERLYQQMAIHVGVMSLVPVPESDLGRLPLLYRRDGTESWHYFIASPHVKRQAPAVVACR